MFEMLQIVSLAAILTVTTAQCSGRLTNSSFALSWSVNNAHVRFTMSAPSVGNQYIAVGFANTSNSDVSFILSVSFLNFFIGVHFRLDVSD